MGKSEKPSNVIDNQMDYNVFDRVVDYKYYWQKEYPVEEYIKLCMTYSDHIALGEKMYNLLNDIRDLANGKFSGLVKKEYILSLEIGKKIG
jgi:hypothetical protein